MEIISQSKRKNIRKMDKIKLLITAGPTCEDIDSIRFITNRSTGNIGILIAAEASKIGCDVKLILGNTHIKPPENINTINVRSADDMYKAVIQNFSETDGLIMAAAVADYTPAEPIRGKFKKTDQDMYLKLKRTTDILKEVGNRQDRAGKILIGFALDAELNLQEGQRKLIQKKLDAIIVNTVNSFGDGTGAVHAIVADGDGFNAENIDKRTLAKQTAELWMKLYKRKTKQNSESL